MAFGYHFSTPSDAQFMDRRRKLLDFYGNAAQFSIIPVLLVYQIPFLIALIRRRRATDNGEKSPSSPHRKHSLEADHASNANRVRRLWSSWEWWAGNSVALPGGYHVGTKGELVLGATWALWLLFLCFNQTGEDYLHLTKRFAIVGASQLPLHYLLAVKSPYSPLQMLTRLSHEQLNQAHRVLGRIIQLLLTLHATFYLNFYVRMNLLAKRTKDRDVIIGLTGISLLTLLSTSALGFVRKINYRVFYFIHVTIASAFLPLMYFHVQYIRVYILEALLVLVVHFLLRYLSTKTYPAAIGMVPGTSLIRVDIASSTLGSVRWLPGQHIYLRLPSTNPLRTNPFTIASLPDGDTSLRLVARALGGNTQTLAALASPQPGTQRDHSASKYRPIPIQLRIEGPYGAAAHQPNLLTYDRILLIAGGVGATFIIPIWRSILIARAGRSGSRHHAPSVKLVWSVRSVEEVSWAFEAGEDDASSKMPSSLPLLPGDETDLYITAPRLRTANNDKTTTDTEGMELHPSTRHTSLPQGAPPGTQTHLSLRPPLRDIIDETFSGPSREGRRVAVLVCGPPGMAGEVRRHVGRWVGKGREVFWWAEEFGL